MTHHQDHHIFTEPDAEAEVACLHILVSEAQQLGKHGASPWRRAAAARLEQHLTELIPTTRARLRLTTT